MPSSSAPHSFNKHGHSQLIEWIVRALKRLPHEMQACLQRYHLHAESKEPLKVGTACSGTDSPVLVARAYAEAVRQLWGANREVEHVFSCERNAKKRHFLANMFCNTFDSSHAMGSLYEDAVDLQFGPEGMSLDVLSDNISEVGTCCDLWAGFPCQDVSKLNPAAGQNRSVIKDSAKRTGAVFNYVLRYFAKVSDPGRALLLENVLGLLDRPPGINPETGQDFRSNLEHCNHLASRAGLRMFSFVLDPRCFGVPVSRQRVWMFCLPLDLWHATMGEASLESTQDRAAV